MLPLRLWISFILISSLTLIVRGTPTIHKFQDSTSTHCVITNETDRTAAVIIANNTILEASPSVEPMDTICEISTNITCSKKLFNRIWKADMSDNYDLLPITDRRWEKLPLTCINPSGIWRMNGGKEICTEGPYVMNKTIENNIGRYSFSFLPHASVASEAYIYLCEIDHDVFCYKIIIQPNKKSTVYYYGLTYPNYNIRSNGTSFSTNWVHFTLYIKNDDYTIISDSNVTLVHFNDRRLTPRYILISNQKSSDWKIQSYGILVSNTNKGVETVDLGLYGKNGQEVCIAVFAYSCTDCIITLILRDQDYNVISLYRQELKNVWQEVKLKGTLTSDSSLKLTTEVEAITGDHAFLGDITDCSRNIRILSANTHPRQTEPICRFLKFPDIQQQIPESNFKLFANSDTRSDVVWLNNKQSNFSEIKIRYKVCDSSEEPYNFKIEKSFIKLESLLIGQLKTTPNATYEFFSNDFMNTALAVNNTSLSKLRRNDEIKPAIYKQGHNYSTISVYIGLFVFLLTMGISLPIVFYMMYKGKIKSCPSYWLPETTIPVNAEEILLSSTVNVKQLQQYVTENLDEIKKQYKMIENLDGKLQTIGMLPQNIRKNRHDGRIAYDDNRVVLSPLYANTCSDYINPNYIKGFSKEKAYIATQAPSVETIHDFWLMIWQDQIDCIVMLTSVFQDGKKICEEYYPLQKGETLEIGRFKISNYSPTIRNNMTTTFLTVSHNGTVRRLTHILYTEWLTKELPISTQGVIDILNAMEGFQRDSTPIVIHCSDGVGLTGVLILCDLALQMVRAKGSIDMCSILQNLREQRPKIVSTLQQYIFAHHVIIHATEPLYQDIV